MPRPLIFKNQKKPKAMTLKVKFDRILGRLREKDGDSTPTPPVTHSLTAVTTPGNQTYLADEQTSPGMTVTVKLYFDGTIVDAASLPTGWLHAGLGTYTRHIDHPGSVDAQQWTYVHEGRTYTANSQKRTLTAIWPAYWGIYPSNDAGGDIRAIVADLAGQHRETANANRTVAVPNPTASSCWLWIVARNYADAESTATPGISIMEAPVTGKSFTSPVNPSINLSDYKAYVSMHSAKAGASFGNVKLTINL